MKYSIAVLLLFSVFGSAQCLGPKAAIGIKPGLNFTTFNPDDGGGNLAGAGFNIGLGFGVDAGSFGLEFTPSYRSTSYRRTDENLNTTISWHYSNFYLPVRGRLIANLQKVAPYLGLGVAFDLQQSGYFVLQVGESSFRTNIPSDDLENDLFISVVLGSDIKSKSFKLAPELAFDYNLTADNDETANRSETNYDITFSVGFYYTP